MGSSAEAENQLEVQVRFLVFDSTDKCKLEGTLALI